MKKYIVAIMAAAFALVASAEIVSLKKGLNVSLGSGKIAAVEAVTEVENQAVTIKAVKAIAIETNAVREVVRIRPRFSMTLTNWYGVASVSTNVWDRFDPEDFRPDNTNHIVGAVAENYIPFTNQVVIGKVASGFITVTNDVWSGTASGHYKIDLPTNKYLVGGALLLNCGDCDSVTLVIE